MCTEPVHRTIYFSQVKHCFPRIHEELGRCTLRSARPRLAAAAVGGWIRSSMCWISFRNGRRPERHSSVRLYEQFWPDRNCLKG